MKLPPLPDAGHPMLQWAPDAQHDLRAYGLACARAALEQAARRIRDELTSVSASQEEKALAEWYATSLDVMAKEIT